MNNLLNVNIKGANRQRITINGDENRIIELNLTDMNFIPRLNSTYPKLEELQAKYTDAEISEGVEGFNKLADILLDLDTSAKEYINYIFDYDVCTPIIDNSSLFAPIDGKLTFEYILDTLINLYTDSIQAEYKKMEKNVKKNTVKYTKKG